MNREPGPLAIAIPAYRPADALVDLVRTLSERGAPVILVVDDGSGPEYREVFARAAAVPGVHLLRHAVHRGRGAALQTAINLALCEFPDLAGMVTADPCLDPNDILRLCDCSREHPDSLILGSRGNDRDASLSGRLGKAVTGEILHALLGQKFTGAKTAVSAIPSSLLSGLLQLKASGPEFDIETLLAAHRLGIPMREECMQNRPQAGEAVGSACPTSDGAGFPGVAQALPPAFPDSVTTSQAFDSSFHFLLRLASFAIRSAASRIRLIPALFAIAFAALLGVEIHGLRSTHLFAQDIWYPIGLKRFTRYGGEYLALAVPLLLLVPWTFAGIIAALLLVLTAVSVGPQPLLAAGFFLISSCALGSILLGKGKTGSLATQLCATLLGSGVYVFLMTFMARLPVNYPWVWGILLAMPVAADIRGVWRRLTGWASRIGSVELHAPGERASFAFLIFILIAQWFGAMLPEISADGLAMHLAIPMNIAANHRMTFEPGRYLWSVMPMGADWLYSIVFLLGGEYAARILNFAMFLVIVALLYRATRRWLTPAAGFLLAASFAATPVVQFVTGSLFVENFLVALVLGLMTALWHFAETGDRRFLYLATVAGGTAMATKYGAFVFLFLALPFAIAEIARHWKSLGPRPAAVCALALFLLLATALPTYAIAYEKTGNPIFPFLNQKIHSPLLNPSVLIADARFRIPVDWNALYTLTFHTTKAYEGQDGSFGFQYMVVAPLALLGLLVARRRPAQAAAVLGVGGGVLIMQSTPNVRYLYTAMPLLAIAFAGLLGWMMSNQRWMYRILIVYLIASTALNTYFLPSSNYYHKDFCLRLPFSRAERDRYLEEAAPVRSVIAYYNRNHPNSAVLLTSSNSIAGLTGEVFDNNWHQFPIVEQLRTAHAPLDMLHLMEHWKVGYFIVEKLAPDDQTVPPALEALLSACTVPEYVSGAFSLARLRPDCGPPAAAPPADSRVEVDPAKQPVLPEGVYDDFNPSIAFRGDWAHDKSFDGPYGHTISYSDTPEAEVSIAFQGTALTYVFTRAPNRGIAAVTIDGDAPHTIDLYSADVEWRARQTFCCFNAGKHRATIEVTGQSNRKSTGRFVDLDSFVVQ